MFLGIKLTHRSSESRKFSSDLKVVLRTWFYECVREANLALPSGSITATQWDKLEQSIQNIREQSTSFCELLSDGRLLYTLAYVLQYTQTSLHTKDRLVRSIFKANVNRSLHQITPFHSMERIQSFLRWCREVVELEERYTFTSLELVHDKNESSVCVCLNALRERFNSDSKEQSVPSFSRIVNRKSIEARIKTQDAKRSTKLDDFLYRFTDKVVRTSFREQIKKPVGKIEQHKKPAEEPEHIEQPVEKAAERPERRTERATFYKEDKVLKKNNAYSSKLSAFLKDVPMPSRIQPQLEKVMSNETDTEVDTEEDEGNNSLPRDSDKADESNQMDAEETSNWKNVNLSLGPMDDEYDEDIFEDDSHISYDSHQHCASPAMMPLPYSPSAMTSFFSHDRILPAKHEEKSFEDGGFRGKTNTSEKIQKLRESQRVIEDLTMQLSAAREAHLKEKKEFLAQLDQEKEEVERLRACNMVQAAEIEKLSKLLESVMEDAQNSKDNEEAARHAARIAFAARDGMQAQLES